MVVRSNRHHAPVLELELLRSRTFSGAFGASLLYYAGFGAWLLALVEFLTGVWHYSAVRAGLAIAPGPLMVLPFAWVIAPRLATRPVVRAAFAAIGCAVNLCAQVYWFTHLEAHSAYVVSLLPAQLIGGMGVGLTIPSLLGAGAESIPANRFGTGSGILNMARQIGTVIGVAALIAVLSHTPAADPIAAFRHGVVLVGAFFAAAFVASAALLTAKPVVQTMPDPDGADLTMTNQSVVAQ